MFWVTLLDFSQFYSKFLVNHMKQILIESIKQDEVVEINTKYFLNIKIFFKLLQKINPTVSIGSDANSKDELVRSYDLIRLNIL